MNRQYKMVIVSLVSVLVSLFITGGFTVSASVHEADAVCENIKGNDDLYEMYVESIFGQYGYRSSGINATVSAESPLYESARRETLSELEK